MPIVTASSEECSSRCRLASFLFLHCLGTVNWVFFPSRFWLLFSSCCHHFFVVVFADPRSEDMMAVTGYCLILPHSHCGLVNFRSGTGNGFFSVDSSIIFANCTNCCSRASLSWQHCFFLPRLLAVTCKRLQQKVCVSTLGLWSIECKKRGNCGFSASHRRKQKRSRDDDRDASYILLWSYLLYRVKPGERTWIKHNGTGWISSRAWFMLKLSMLTFYDTFQLVGVKQW